MTKKKKGKHLFKKGNPGGPGRPRLEPELKAVQPLKKDEVRKRLTAYLRMNVGELEKIVDDKKRPSLDVWIAQLALKGIRDGDYTRMNFIFDRIVGRVKDEVEHKMVKPTIIERLDGSTIEMRQVVATEETFEEGENES